ncbi:hypothetical protein OKA05_14845 [Luteolibacter arcticus]|uniref:LamG-like jellyroll fold domain-containing protein n=1 Tax=Luteolibacter arcticus TaxID=1581411 RepID=A0ABT3GJY9_9BACT|nr:LamG-like jellyroll fold domain-containing protein [Luteolibacter arcticus]MCW1923843.1 hypothetical protein [Luteolibacter arcticus]
MTIVSTTFAIATLLVTPCLGAAIETRAAPAPEGTAIVARHTIVFDKTATRVPTNFMVDGPLLGNGDIGVVQAGPPENLLFYIGKNDFWSIQTQAPTPVGQLQILTPALKGATFRTEQDMLLAETRGRFTQGKSELSTRSFVDANGNGFIQSLGNSGQEPLTIEVRTLKGAAVAVADVPARVNPPPKPPLFGCEQHGENRWFFRGAMADARVQDRALSAAEVVALAKTRRGEAERFDGKTSRPANAPVIDKAMTFSAWVKPDTFSDEADYLLSSGDWDHAYSFGFSSGHPRFSLHGIAFQHPGTIPLGQWTHVAAVFDGKSMRIYLNGLAGNDDAGDSFLLDPDAKPEGRKAGVSTRVLFKDGSRTFTLAPGETAIVATVILSDLDVGSPDPLATAKTKAAALTPATIKQQVLGHRAWWNNFWSQSFIEIPDKVIEQNWYSSQYVMASCSRKGKVAPGLWGNWITTRTPAWHGDFHLNYNFQAPFYSLYAANHTDGTLPFYEALNQSIPRGRSIAQKRGWKGIHLPVSIGPWGMCPEGDNSDHGQRSNTAYSALLYIWHWQYTRDEAWLEHDGYAFVRETALFWEDYLKLENGRYVIYNDSIHEGSGADFNPLLSLGLVRTLFQNIVPMSEVLGLDTAKRAKWKDISEKLSAFPTQERGGKTVFRYSEKGTPWWGDNTLGIQHIFPAGSIGLDSDPGLLEISHNMLDAMGRWRDYNGSSSWYTACARVGYQPARILTELRHMLDTHSLPNRLLNFGGGGIENASPSLAVTEMLLQSHDGKIRFFPCWPKEQDARFGSLRAVGAFLVWGEWKGGVVAGVKIVSEKGEDCTIVNPWPGKKVQVLRTGKAANTVEGTHFTLETTVGESLELKVDS